MRSIKSRALRLAAHARRYLRWLTAGLDDRTESFELIRRRVFVCVLIALAVPMLFWFAWLEYLAAFYVMVPILAGTAVLFSMLFVLIRAGSNELILSRIALGFALLPCFAPLFLDRGPQQLFYLLLIPLVAVFVFGIREGLAWALAVLFRRRVFVCVLIALAVPARIGTIT